MLGYLVMTVLEDQQITAPGCFFCFFSDTILRSTGWTKVYSAVRLPVGVCVCACAVKHTSSSSSSARASRRAQAPTAEINHQFFSKAIYRLWRFYWVFLQTVEFRFINFDGLSLLLQCTHTSHSSDGGGVNVLLFLSPLRKRLLIQYVQKCLKKANYT